MSDKLKKSTGGKLLLRSGGLALSLPIVIGLGAVLLLVNSLMAMLIIGALLTGDAFIAPYLGILAITLAVGVWSQLLLFRAVFRYTGGIGKLWGRMRGIQDERARVERLIDNQHISEDNIRSLIDMDDQQQQSKRQ